MEIDPAAPRLPLAGSGRACVRSRAARQIRIRRDDGLVAEGATTLPRDIELRKSRFAPIARVIGGFDPADRNPMDSRHTGALCNCSRKGRPIKPKQFPKVIAGNSRETFTSYRETDAIGRARSMRERERERERCLGFLRSTATWEIGVYALPSGPSPAFLLRVGGYECLADSLHISCPGKHSNLRPTTRRCLRLSPPPETLLLARKSLVQTIPPISPLFCSSRGRLGNFRSRFLVAIITADDRA